MDYLRMWLKLKEQLMKDINTTDERRKSIIMDMLLEMNNIEVMELPKKKIKLDMVEAINKGGLRSGNHE